MHTVPSLSTVTNELSMCRAIEADGCSDGAGGANL